ncbi:unnamed protein product [Prunus brigantina]
MSRRVLNGIISNSSSPAIAQTEQPVVVVFPAASNTVPSSVQNEVDMVAAQSCFSFYGCPMFVLSSKLRALKAKLKEWNWREFGDIYAKVNDSMRALESIQTEIATLGPSDERFLREDQMFTADADVVNTGLVERVIPSLVTAGDNMLLTSIPSQEEIFGVVNSMDSLKSMNLLDRKCRGGNVAIKFDIQKAFDTLDWGFILRVLTAFGFGEVFVLWIKELLGSAYLSILVNGSPSGYFSCSRGVRQGDPLSPILFCLAQEVFSHGISSLIESGALRRINAPRGVTPPSHVLFADDIMVFIQGTTKNLRVLMRFMAEAFPHLAASIEAIVLPFEPCADHLIWTGAMSGILPAKEAYLWFLPHIASVPWSKVIWDKAIQPRKSLVVWKALQSRLLTDEFLQKRGVSLASGCSFCYRYGETVNHLFLTCPFVMALWKWLLHLFNKSSCPFNSMDNLFVGPFVESFSPSSRKLWLLVACNLVWGIWHLRNQIRFDRLVVCLDYAQRWFLSRFKESGIACFVSGHSPSSPLIFQLLGFLPLNPSAPKFIRVLWSPPPTGWVKVNIDGSCKASGTGFGGVFRNSEGKVLGAFASNQDQPSSTAAEVLAFLEAIRVAWVRDWKHLWLETDSSLVVQFFSSTSYSIPWSLRTEWRNCLWRIKQMHFVCTHIYREGNCVADMLANFGADNHAYYWWDSLPSWAAIAYAKDLVGFPRFRFR